MCLYHKLNLTSSILRIWIEENVTQQKSVGSFTKTQKLNLNVFTASILLLNKL